MRAWFLFAILGFLVFGVPLIDELYKMRLRRNAKGGGDQALQERVSLVPEVNGETLIGSNDATTYGKVLEEAYTKI
jgi:hypothetical protein